MLGGKFFNALNLEFLCNKLCTYRNVKGLHFTFYKLFFLSNCLSIFITVVTHILLFNRLRHLEKKRAEGIMVITYHRDGVTISRNSPDLLTNKKLWKHNRTVVSPKASLMSFILSIPFRIALGFLFSNNYITVHLVQTMSLCHHFFFYNLVESLFSPALRTSLSQMLPWYQKAHHVLNV